jgi:tetratricopeptide (TPR) repeat protein
LTPSHERLVEVQQLLTDLADVVQREPAATFDPLDGLITETAEWTNKRAFVWATHILCQALRGTDRLDDAAGAARAARSVAVDAAPELVAHLDLELGIALRMSNKHHEACSALSLALDYFRQNKEASGEAWSLLELGVLHRFIGKLGTSRTLLRGSLIAAEQAGDGPAVRRATREAAVTLRFEGQSGRAVEALLELVGMETPGTHGLANTLKELAASENEISRIDDAQTHYRRAAELYERLGDRVGIANVERALGNITAQLNRYSESLGHLDAAIEHFRAVSYRTSEANGLRDRSLVHLARKQTVEAADDAVRAWRIYVTELDPVGEAGALRALAQIADAVGRRSLVRRSLRRARRLDRLNGVKLSAANTLLHIASFSDDHAEALEAAGEAAGLYDDMALEVGALQAASLAAGHAYQLGRLEEAFTWARRGCSAVQLARLRFRNVDDRADFGFTAAQATSRIYEVLNNLATSEASREASALVASDGPVAGIAVIRRPLQTRLDPATRSLLTSMTTVEQPLVRSGYLRRLGAALGQVPTDLALPDQLIDECRLRLGVDQAMVIYGTPVSGKALPVLTLIGGEQARFELLNLSEQHVEMIDRLGQPQVDGLDDLEMLWRPQLFDRWTTELGISMLPASIVEWVQAASNRTLYLAPHQSLSHIPFEALRIDASPLGATVAITRLPYRRIPEQPAPSPNLAIGFVDPILDTAIERRSFHGVLASDCVDLRSRIGPDQLIWICAHGTSDLDLGGSLRTTSGDRVLDAADLLSVDLSGSAMLFESCWAGRHFGSSFGEATSLATAALIAGASEVGAGLFPLPISPDCTGVIVAAVLAAAATGSGLAVALQMARADHLKRATFAVHLPGHEDTELRSDAPLFWAGLVALS